MGVLYHGSTHYSLRQAYYHNKIIKLMLQVAHLLPPLLRVHHDFGFNACVNANSNDPVSVLKLGSFEKELSFF